MKPDAIFELEPLSYTSCLPGVVAVSSALSPETWPFSLEWLPRSACLVGGTVRDALLGRQGDYLDLDFVLPEDAIATAEAIARHYKAGYVLLDAERQIARVVFNQGTVDFAKQVGPTLITDLERRDFTVNAIAYNPHTDQLIDPLHGYSDLQKRQLRMVSAVNLEEDPLRLLRAFRQAAQLGFIIEEETRQTIRSLAPLLNRIASERIQSEMNYLLSTAKGTSWLAKACKDGLLRDWMPDVNATSLETVAEIDRLFFWFQQSLPHFAEILSSRIKNLPRTTRTGAPAHPSTPRLSENLEMKSAGVSRTWLSTAKLVSLLPDNIPTAEAQLRRLKYSRTEIQAVNVILKFLPELFRGLASGRQTDAAELESPSLRWQYTFFQAVGGTFPAVALLAIARGLPVEQVLPLIYRFLNPDDPVAHPQALLTGQDIMCHLKLPPGPHIGQILAAIQLARAEGRIATAAEALMLAGDWVKNQES